MSDLQDFPSKLQRLLELGSATVCESQQSKGVIGSGIRVIHPSMRMVGPAFTVDLRPGDNLMIHYAILKTKPGDVLVVDAKGFLDAGIWGDVLTEQALTRKLAGILINGAVRDTGPIKEMGFPVFSRGICIKGASKIMPGEINVPIIIDDVQINPGDIVLGDQDGIVIIPSGKFDGVLDKATEREQKETRFIELIRKGDDTVNLLNLKGELEKNNCRID